MRGVSEILVWPFQPMIDTVSGYSFGKLRGDMKAAISVAIVSVPQAIAFAAIAEMPPIYGIYGVIVQSIIGSFLSSSNHLAIGPTNTISLLVASVAGGMVAPDEISGPVYVGLVASLALISGAMQASFALARLGALFRYVSHSVIVGFTAGAGILIIAKQAPRFLGIPGVENLDDRWPGLEGVIQEYGPNVLQIDSAVVLIGAASLLTLVAVRRVNRLLPAPLFAVIVGSVLVYALGWGPDDERVTGALSGEFSSPVVPSIDFGKLEGLLQGGLAIALLGMLEAVAIGKSVALRTGERINPTREFFGQGVTNMFSSLFGCYPGTGSFSRTALNHMVGARTRIAGIANGVFVAIILLSCGYLGRYLPKASLAAILFVVAWGLIDFRHLRHIARSNRSDAAVCLATLLATVFIPLEYAIFVGIFLNLALYLRSSSQLHIAEMVSTPGGRFVERPLHARHGGQKIVFLQIEGDLFFGIADELQDRLGEVGRSGAKIVIVRLKRMHSIDFTTLSVFERFATALKEDGGQLILCGLKPETLRRFERFGLATIIGRENIFETTYGVFTSAKKAITRAKELAGSSIDTEGIDLEEEQGWMYQI